MRIASIQLKVIEESKKKALKHVSRMVRKCRGADLILLPELWNIGFMSFDRYREEAETQNGPTLTLLRALAKELSCHLQTGSFVEKREDRLYNSSFLLNPEGEILGSYQKIHLFTYQSQEAQILTPGKSTVVISTEFGRFGLATCYDLRFPELFRKMLDQGAEFFLVSSAWPSPRLEHWLLFNRTRALENLSFLISSNCVGINRGTSFIGHSLAVGPMGQLIAEGNDEECIVWADLDRETVLKAREEFPALRDRMFKS
ncbi:MAG: carbon-nitrogen family hydrolase [Syntrophaceae bacterium]|nr:carbon-nitrogen family hydrolase [Syntrophaceae bacterium]